MSEIALILGICFFAGLCLYFALNLTEDHFILKLILIFFSLISTFYIVPVFTNGVTLTAQTFIKIPYGLFILFCLYFITYIFYYWFGQPKLLGKLLGIKAK